MTTKVGKLEKVLDISNRITSDFSGFHAVDTLSRRLAAITSFDKLAMHAIGKSKVTDAVLKRYRNIGFSDDELQAVFKNIREKLSSSLLESFSIKSSKYIYSPIMTFKLEINVFNKSPWI